MDNNVTYKVTIETVDDEEYSYQRGTPVMFRDLRQIFANISRDGFTYEQFSGKVSFLHFPPHRIKNIRADKV